MTNKEIGNRIRSCREQSGMTLKELADRIRVADTTIMRYEKGDIQKIKLPIIQSIAAELNVNPSWLIGESEIKNIINNKPVLKDVYFNFASEMQSKDVSEDDMKRLWEFYDMIQNARK